MISPGSTGNSPANISPVSVVSLERVVGRHRPADPRQESAVAFLQLTHFSTGMVIRMSRAITGDLISEQINVKPDQTCFLSMKLLYLVILKFVVIPLLKFDVGD